MEIILDLPWINIEKQNLKQKAKFLKICSIKSSIKPEELCSGLPKEFSQYIKYCKNLKFEQQPNYNYLRNLFIEVIKINEKFIDTRFINFMEFSWLKNNNIKKINICTKYENQYLSDSNEYNNNKKRGNLHQRLFKQIKESMDKSRSQEALGLKKSNFFSFNLKNINIILNKNEGDMFPTKKSRNSYNNFKLNKIGVSNCSRGKTEQSSIEKLKLKKIKVPILTKSIYNKNIDNLIYLNPLKKIKILTLNNDTKKSSSSTKFENKSIDSFTNFGKFHHYRTLEQREKEKKLKKNYILFNN